MDAKQLKEFTRHGTIQILAIPSLESALTMGHKKRINLLRFCPFSKFFGLNEARFNVNSMNKTRSIIIVCDMIKAHSHLKSGLSEIDETDSIFERSCSIQIGELDPANDNGNEGLFDDSDEEAGFDALKEQDQDHQKQ